MPLPFWKYFPPLVTLIVYLQLQQHPVLTQEMLEQLVAPMMLQMLTTLPAPRHLTYGDNSFDK